MRRYIAIAVVFAAPAAWYAYAQQTERPGCTVDNPIDFPRDPSGLSIKNPRVRVVHTTDPWLVGGSMYLQTVDPFLGFAWGRSLFQRQFRERDGVFGESGKFDGPRLPDGATKMMDRGHVSSCGGCHNVPYRDAGAGMTIAKNGGTGRNTPHLFGGGLLEMLGDHMRREALALADPERKGWIRSADVKGKRCRISPLPNAEPIDYGSFDDENGDGLPDLNAVFYPVFVDSDGLRIAWAKNLNDPGVAGYTVQVQSMGFGHLYTPFRPPVQTTLRAFSAVPFDIHAGMQAHDPTTYSTNGTALGRISNAGQQQFASEAQRDRGGMRGPTGLSLDDPDRDGFVEEITEGDLDAVEWYLLNHPAPTRGPRTRMVAKGEKVFARIGCASCHTPDWATPSGDRRLFNLQVGFDRKSGRLQGKLVMLADKVGDRWVPRQGPVEVKGLYSDLKYHYMGSDFEQVQFDGSVVRLWRTVPLWGVGSTAPYGHDGACLDLDSVIRRHGGEGHASRNKYSKLGASDRRAVIEFLQSLVLYNTDQIPCDVNGDGRIDEHFMVQGVDTGRERFNPEWLFRVPGKIEGAAVGPTGDRIASQSLVNLREAYGLDLPFLLDYDGDGFPDVIDPRPRTAGFRDGIK